MQQSLDQFLFTNIKRNQSREGFQVFKGFNVLYAQKVRVRRGVFSWLNLKPHFERPVNPTHTYLKTEVQITLKPTQT